MSDMKQQEIVSDESAIGVYSSLREEIFLRTGQQHKCVEQSILITTAVVGGMLASLVSKDIQDALSKVVEVPIWTLFAIFAVTLYVLVQELLLTNYIYQIWLMMQIHNFISLHSDQPKGKKGLFIGCYERNYDKKLMQRSGGFFKIIQYFQPLLIYVSIGLGFCGAIFLFVLICMNVQSNRSQIIISMIPILSVLGVLILLAICHRRSAFVFRQKDSK